MSDKITTIPIKRHNEIVERLTTEYFDKVWEVKMQLMKKAQVIEKLEEKIRELGR